MFQPMIYTEACGEDLQGYRAMNQLELFDLAERYCRWIDVSGEDQPHWLQEIARLLPRLEASIQSLQQLKADTEPSLFPDLDARFELYTHLRKLLGDRDGYPLELDEPGDTEITGSLADDLTDIYCELKHGLRFAEVAPEQVLKEWRRGFHYHWGQHLADAQRHLARLAAQGRLLA